MSEDAGSGMPKTPEAEVSLDALRALIDAMPPSPERDGPQRLWNRRRGHCLDDLKRREARLHVVEQVVKRGFYLVVGCAAGAGLGVWPLDRIPSTWASGAAVIASAVYAAVIWWHYRCALRVIRARAGLPGEP